MKQKVSGKTAVITGGASGLGRLVSLDLAGRGVRVIAWDLDREALDGVAAEARANASSGKGNPCGEIVPMVVDVSDRKAVYAAADKILAERGNVEILINNAGVVSGKKLLDIPDEKIEKTFQVNILSHFWTTKAFLPSMLKNDSGHIVTISSAAGMIGVCGLADYSATKFAAFGFNESLRMELRRLKSSVRTTIVCPFYINTGLFAGVKTRFPLLLPILEPDRVVRKIVRAILRGRQAVITPPIVYTLPILRMFPVGVLDFVAGFLGVSSSMDEFKGRDNGNR